MLIGPNIAHGLNLRGLSVTADLNPEPKAIVALGQLQEVKVDGFDGNTVTFPDPDAPFRDDESSWHKDDGFVESPQHEATGLDPQADPPQLFRDDESRYDCDDGDTESPQHETTGLDPQADPDKLFHLDESTSAKPEGITESPQHTETGLEPTQAPLEHRVDGSTFHKPEGAQEGPQHTGVGLDPQVDPAEQFEPKESGSEDDCDDDG